MEDNRFSMGTKLSEDNERSKVWCALFKKQFPKAVSKSHALWASNALRHSYQLYAEPALESVAIPGWTIVPAWGKVPEPRFWELLFKSKFPVNMQLRHFDEVEYCVLRDTFHDCFGHLPPLHDERYSRSVRFMGYLGSYLTHKGDTKMLKVLSRIYWSIIEFSGMKMSGGNICPLGAGIISSSNETDDFLSNPDKYRNVDLIDISQWDYNPVGIQDRYYIIEDWDQVDRLLHEFADSCCF